VLVEPPHFAVGTVVRDHWLGPDLLFGGRFSYGAVGWSTATLEGEVTNRILDPGARGVFIRGGGPMPGEDGRTDDEIIVDFARALGNDRVALRLLGSVERRYLSGASDSSEAVKRIIDSGLADGLFELALPITTDQPFDPQVAIAAGRYRGKVITVDSEFEWFDARAAEDRGGSPGLYRSYFVAGTPHIPDPLWSFFSNETTPASWKPELRARFVQGNAWVRTGAPPPPSTRLATTSSGDIERDSNGNAVLVDITGQPVPRLPFVELGEATFVTGFLGTYQPQPPPSIQELGYGAHSEYLAEFDGAVANQLSAGSLLPADAQSLRDRAGSRRRPPSPRTTSRATKTFAPASPAREPLSVTSANRPVVVRAIMGGEGGFHSVCKPLHQADPVRRVWRRCGGSAAGSVPRPGVPAPALPPRPGSIPGPACHASDARISISAVVAGGSGGSP
jgi:hypothetical protein